jgi:hypothetical protein
MDRGVERFPSFFGAVAGRVKAIGCSPALSIKTACRRRCAPRSSTLVDRVAVGKHRDSERRVRSSIVISRPDGSASDIEDIRAPDAASLKKLGA